MTGVKVNTVTPPPLPVPQVEALSPPPPVVSPPPVNSPPPVPKRLPPRPPRPPKPAQKADAAPLDAASIEKKRLEVDRKFQQVKSEYLEFKKHFGARLEDRWQGILSDIALGRRDQGLSESLDSLRKEMKQLNAEKN
jgi:hypothetical protein